MRDYRKIIRCVMIQNGTTSVGIRLSGRDDNGSMLLVPPSRLERSKVPTVMALRKSISP